ncbi:MAG: hypothetical protein ORN98_07195 [Alphaproteobacteria bacterium]|nr:hypothetical protein [Alphaproteobacteria bacterium]
MTRQQDFFGEYDRGALSIAIRQLGEQMGAQASRVKHYLHQNYYPEFLPVSGIRRRQILHEIRGFDVVFHKLSADMVRFVYKLEQKIVTEAATQGGGTALMVLNGLRERQKLIDLLLRGIHQKLAHFRGTQIVSKPMIDTNGLYQLCAELEKLALFIQYLAIGAKNSESGLLAFKLGENFAERLLAALPDLRLLELDWSLVQNYLEIGQNPTPQWVEAEIVGHDFAANSDQDEESHAPPLKAQLHAEADFSDPTHAEPKTRTKPPTSPHPAPPPQNAHHPHTVKRSQELRRRLFPYR